MGPITQSRRYRVTVLANGGVRSSDYEDYGEARLHYSSAWRGSSTGDTVEFYEVSGDDKEARILIFDDVDTLPPLPELPAPAVDYLELQRGHKCHWDHLGKCIRCRKPRPFWG
jgi:hypothetical protein